MRFLLLAIGALLGSLLVTRQLARDPGYVLLGYGTWTLESSLATALIALLSGVAVLYLLWRLLLRLLAAPRVLREWDEQRLRRRARDGLLRGLLELAEGHWAAAERAFARAPGHADLPLLSYLHAARAAQAQGARERRDHYLRLAEESMPEAELAVGLTQAELQLADGQDQQALSVLQRLHESVPRHLQVLRLLRDSLERQEDWSGLLELLPELRRGRASEADELLALERRARGALVRQQLLQADREQLRSLWAALPRHLKIEAELVIAFSDAWSRQGRPEQAEQLLRRALERRWSSDLVKSYGELPMADASAQLAVAEAWLRKHPRDPALLYTLGRLCLRQHLWGKARSYLESAIGVGGALRPALYQELAGLLERMGEVEDALRCYREGLRLSSGVEPVSEAPVSSPPALSA